jgi:hypothetical protein
MNGEENCLGIEPTYVTAKLTPVPKTNNSETLAKTVPTFLHIFSAVPCDSKILE